MRKEYCHGVLDDANLPDDPYKLFQEWLKDAVDCKEIPEANSMCLSTCGKDMRVSSRVVLLKGSDEKGFVFFTNY